MACEPSGDWARNFRMQNSEQLSSPHISGGSSLQLSSMSIAWAVNDLRHRGVTRPLPWATAKTARCLAVRVRAEQAAERREIVRNPHREGGWARDAACSLAGPVRAVIGPDVVIENTFLVVKWPGSVFEVPWHQDGTDRRIELDPARLVSAWLALTDATPGQRLLNIRYVAPGAARIRDDTSPALDPISGTAW
jgi:hypothetical protein